MIDIQVSIQQDSTSCGICMLSNVELFINSVSNLYVAWGYNVLVL